MSQSPTQEVPACRSLPHPSIDLPCPRPWREVLTAARLTTDGGLPWLGEAEAALGICAALPPACRSGLQRSVRFPGDAGTSAHLPNRQRSTDQDDADTLRHDPLLELVCRSLARDGGRLSASTDAVAVGERGRLARMLPINACHGRQHVCRDATPRSRTPTGSTSPVPAPDYGPRAPPTTARVAVR